MELERFLNDIPMFSSIPDAQILEIASYFKTIKYKKDDIIFRQNDISNIMYIIRSGAVFIYAEKDGVRQVQVELKRGDFFGEMALLSDSPRNATARVMLDANLFYLEKKDFNHLLSINSRIGLFLSRLYARRLSSGTPGGTGPPRPVFYTLSETDPDLGLSHFLYSMAYHIATESSKKVLVVEPHLELGSIMKKFDLHPILCPNGKLYELLPPDIYSPGDIKWYCHPSEFNVLQVNKGFHSRLVSALPRLMEAFKQDYDLVVFSLTHRFGRLEEQAVRLCDKNLMIINNTPGALVEVKNKLARLKQAGGIGLDRIRVGVSHLCGTTGIAREILKKELNLSETPQIWVERTGKALQDRIDTRKKFPVRGARAIARELAGVRVGLALGAGAARGWSHIGVLKALKEAGIHIDMIAGTSMGALVGAIFAYKGSVRHLQKFTIQKFPTRSTARKKIFDPVIPLRGFLKGRKALNLVAQAIDHADFMDLAIPTYIVGVDILNGEEILFETGDVSKAVRSSLSLPGVFVPYRYRDRWMVDGGLLNPVPVNILEQKGADKIIAVCVENPHSKSQISSNRSPHILQVIFRTVNIVHSTATKGFTQKSDIVIYPDAREFAWDDFHKGKILMQRGETACKKVISEIQSLIRENA